jgi:predicted Fe-Mo cluster-binding NifX family protein
MKVAVPVKDDTLTFFGNAGHTPYFAVYAVSGAGMFKAFKFEELRKNPRTDLDHEHNDGNEHCSHGHDDEAHVKEHVKMAELLEDCDYLVAKRACKNTAAAMVNYGISISKYNGDATKADAVLSGVSAQLV